MTKAVPIRRRRHAGLAAGMGQHIAHEVHAAELPRGVQHCGVNVFLAGICRCAQRAAQSLTIPQT